MDALAAAARRVRELAAGWRAPAFEHVPDPDCAIFLCAVDHRTGYEEAHTVDGRGPFAGSELMWELGLRAHRAEGGGLLRAARLSAVGEGDLSRWFDAGGETVDDPGRRTALWRDLAAGLERDHDGEAARLLEASRGRLGGAEGLVALLARYEAYADPLAKKAFLFAKICERRGWLEVVDPESWEVSADNVLMRLALRSGLVEPGPLEEVRPATRAALKQLAAAAEMSPPVLDDLLWELGREDPDLLGAGAGELMEPPRDPGSAWF
jgi:hypothetical protein